jgi:hypothetical protein
MGDDSWRDRLSKLLSGLGRAWALKSRVALGAAMVSATAMASLPAGTAEAKVEPAGVVAPAPSKQSKLAGKFMLLRGNGVAGKTFAEHGSHSSHSSHRSHASHRSGAWAR